MFEKYRAKRELKKRIDGFGEDKKIKYLTRILNKKSKLAEPTREAASFLLGESYIKRGNSRDYLDAAKSYANAGEFPHAKACLRKSEEIGLYDVDEVRHFVNIKLRHKGRKSPRNKLEKTAITSAIIGLIIAIFFLSPNLTGNAIGDLTNYTSNWIGGILFIVGLICVFTFFKKK